MDQSLAQLVTPQWPPVAHIQAGWDALTEAERADVQARLKRVDMTVKGRPQVTLPFFAFLAQVETIAIEIPLRFLPHAPADVQPLLRRQLVDEVFHSTLFSRIAHELAQPSGLPPAPLASAEKLLDRIRAEPDLAVSATLLNLVAEGWIENLFRHAAKWGVADDVFATVLEDEARHVEEATQYHQGLDHTSAAAAVERFEAGLLEVMREPTVGLAMHELAGDAAYQAMIEEMHAAHRQHLAEVDLQPSVAWVQQENVTNQFLAQWSETERAKLVDDTPWRQSARQLWNTPRDPTMQGDVDIPVGKIPKKLLTPMMVAAVGRAFAAHPELNRVLAKGRVWQLPRVNVGVRVLIDETELATVVITDADKRSLRDISRMIIDGVQQLETVRKYQKDNKMEVAPFDDKVMALADPGIASFAVALSNPGKFGLVRGGGAFSGEMAPSTDISVGQRRRLPVWKGIGYFPSWHVNFGCLQDHRLFDGREAGVAMQSVLKQMGRRERKAIFATKDTIPADEKLPGQRMAAMAPAELRMLSSVGISKYLPIALGAAGIATGLGFATYYIMQQAGMVGGAAAGAAAGIAGAGGCHGMTAAGNVCDAKAGDGDFCWRHEGQQ